MIQFTDIMPGPTDRAAFVGQTGSGKTTLAEYACSLRRHVVVFDAKGTINWPGYVVYKRLAKATATKDERIIYRPDFDELADMESTERFFKWIYLRGNCLVYIDEVFSITNGEIMPRYYHACLTRGRERGIQVYSSTQRPKGIPQVILSESEHLYAFRLVMPQDRERVASLCGLEADKMKQLPKFQFWYAPQGGEVAGPLRLRI